MQNLTFQISTIDWGAISAISTIAIALLGFKINSRLKKLNTQQQRYALLVEYRQELIAFSDQFFDLVAQGVALAAQKGQQSGGLDSSGDINAFLISERLSSLVDRGRFVFPNYIHCSNGFGTEKGPAFAGLRREPLDAIMAAYYATKAICDFEKRDANRLCAIRELQKTRQPLSVDLNKDSLVAILIEARRCYLNAVVPDTFPREWRTMFSELLGPVSSLEQP